ncbi:lymphocyte antigen 75 [Oreochromis aureus]|uniref:C-type lectin domain-containing protein n=1 Tax=Oreochromis aureus TaxID=47969 RepID=A0AAZ1Y3A8_OREAU|nr:lymphocyte antigen 75 [Oreochromis aureus]XP_039456602.1 lymphocyte antigen 75 [Oreochromis aureus]
MSLSLTVLMMTSVLLVLSLGLFDFTVGSHLQSVSFFSEEEGRMNWTGSLNACQSTGSSLVTVYDQEDLNALLKNGVPRSDFWSGLHKNKSSVTTWSDGNSLAFNISQVTSIGDDQICEAMTNRTWRAFNCSDRKPFMCYKDNNYILITEEKDWCQALQYCRRHYTDLVSISNKTQNDKVSEKGKNKTFWIGLQHDQWTWADGSCSTYRNWSNSKENSCSVFDTMGLFKLKCENVKKRICTKGNMRIKVIQNNYTWEEALNYCERKHNGLLWIEDEEDQKVVEQWLNHTDVEGPFWIGLRQSTLFGFWIWKDRTVGYSNWKNDKIPAMPMSNRCGVIVKRNTTGKWKDEDCWRQHHFLCEEEIVLMNKK